MHFGAHVPTRGRLSRAFDYARTVGAEAIQLFISNPRSWAPPSLTVEDAQEFRERRGRAGIGPVLVHASYLVNVASPDLSFLRRSVELAASELRAAAAIGADGLVVHAGAGAEIPRREALERATAAIRTIAGAAEAPVLIELTAGGTGAVASTIPQAAELLDSVDLEEVGLVLDTCHLLAAGYPLDEPGTDPSPFDDLRRLGIDRRLRAIHANDSRDPRGSRRDRHAHVGQGTIGEDGFAAILSDPTVSGCALLVETPGDEEEDVMNLATLRRLAGV